MTSPAQRHMMRVSAAMTAQREAAPLRHATVYEQMLVKLAADQRTLKAIYSKELKAAKKRELLPFWLPWVNGVLEQGKGAQDDILMTVMLWRLDTGDIAGALEIARYALKYGLTMPGTRRAWPSVLSLHGRFWRRLSVWLPVVSACMPRSMCWNATGGSCRRNRWP